MPNYRRQGGQRYGKRARGVSTLLITAVVIVGIFLGLRYLLSGSGNNENTNNEHEIQTLESLLEDQNIPLDTADESALTQTPSCDGLVTTFATEEKKVALTFDSINITDKANDILTTLKEKNVPAFFFLTGDFANDHPDLVQEIEGNGFGIGNHSNTHRYFTQLEASDIASELSLAQENIIAAGGSPVKLVRPPYNSTNESVIQTILDQGYCPITYSIDSKDAETESTPETVIESVTSSVRQGGIIWMLHGHVTASDALPTIIDNVRNAGYEFVDIEDIIIPPTASTNSSSTNETNVNT